MKQLKKYSKKEVGDLMEKWSHKTYYHVDVKNDEDLKWMLDNKYLSIVPEYQNAYYECNWKKFLEDF